MERKFWLRDHIILLAKFFAILSLFKINLVFAQDIFKFNVGDEVNVYSDKAYRNENINKLVGNVVITHKDETLYGESASMDMVKGEIEVEGNVRYVSPLLTVYGSKLIYNMKTAKMTIENSRVISEFYSLVGKNITKISEDVFIAEDAEYTTCRDCPESWSIYGKHVRLKAEQYVQIRNAMIRINSVNILYLPYMVMPITKDRETGLLFPSFSLFNREGLWFQQPFFWAINPHSDMTLTPSTWGKRGYGSDLEYRQLFGEEKWVNINSRLLQDKIYRPHKSTSEESNNPYFRYFSDYEHHFQFGNNLTHHTRYVSMKDLDMVRIFRGYTDPRIQGSEIGFSSFFDFRSEIASVSLQGDFNQNQLVSDPLLFDKKYVQVLPSTTFRFIPVSLINSDVPFFQNITFGGHLTHTKFRQQESDESLYLRNADRINAMPYLDWNMADIGPVHLKTLYNFENQHYDFRQSGEENFSKQLSMFTSEASFEVDRIFGLSYSEKIETTRITDDDLKRIEQDEFLQKEKEKEKKKKTTTKKSESTLVSELTPFDESFTEDFVVQTRNSYRHSQEFKFLHYYTTAQKTTGNKRFENQIGTSAGLFDYVDAVRTRENQLGSNLTRTSISPQNTVEFQWNNSLIKKTSRQFDFSQDGRFLKDNFTFAKMGYFNMSQGLLMNSNSEHFKDDLTRLYSTTGYVIGRWNFGVSDYYFYQNSNHIFQTSVTKNFDLASVFTTFNWNMFDQPQTQIMGIGGYVRPVDFINLFTKYDYNYGTKTPINLLYGFDYIPANNCWRLNFTVNRSIVEQRFAFNLMVNFSDNTFTSLNSSMGAVAPVQNSSTLGSPPVKQR